MTNETVNNNLCVMTYTQVQELIAASAANGEKNVVVAGSKVPELLNETEVREMLGVAHSTLWHWQKSGYLPVVKIGAKVRWRKSDVCKLMGGC